MKKIFAIMAALCALAFASCTKEQNAPADDNGGKTPLVFKAYMGRYELKSSTPDYFEEGDKIGLFASFNSYLDEYNTCMTATGGGWYFKADHDLYWNDWNIASSEPWGWAYYPYNPSQTDEDWVICVNADQSTPEKYNESDFRAALLNIKPVEGEVEMYFEHMLSKLLIRITNNTGKEISAVYLANVLGKTDFQPVTLGEAYGSTGTIKACCMNSRSGSSQWAVIIPPQQVCPKLIIATTDGQQYCFETREEEAFYSGWQRNCDITLSEDSSSVEFTDEVANWSDDNTSNFSDDVRSIIEFTDDVLLRGLIDKGLDTNNDGLISKAEALEVTSLDLSGLGFWDIAGLEEFDNLTSLILDSTNVDSGYDALHLPKNLEYLSMNRCRQIGPTLDLALCANAGKIKELHAMECPNVCYVNASGIAPDATVVITGSPVTHIAIPDGASLQQDSYAERAPEFWSLYIYDYATGREIIFPLQAADEARTYWTGSASLVQGKAVAFAKNFSIWSTKYIPDTPDTFWPTGAWYTLAEGELFIGATGTYEFHLDLSDCTCYTAYSKPSQDSIWGIWHAEAADYWGDDTYSWDMEIVQDGNTYLVYNPEPCLGENGFTGPVEASFDGGILTIADWQLLDVTTKYEMYLIGYNQDIRFSYSGGNELKLLTMLGSYAIDAATGEDVGFLNLFDAGIVYTKK